jgi:hypothetical protein
MNETQYLTDNEKRIIDDWLVRNNKPVNRAQFENAVVRFMPRWRVIQLVDEMDYSAPCPAYERYIQEILDGKL